MKTVFIYALCEPGTRTVRYIGKTFNPGRRLGTHVRDSSRKKSHLGNWLRGLLSCGAKPDMIILCEVSEDKWREEEVRQIRDARTLGARLVNANDGGFGENPSAETRKKMSLAATGKRLPPRSREHCAKISAARTGNKHPLFGKSPSPTTRGLISERLRDYHARRRLLTNGGEYGIFE